MTAYDPESDFAALVSPALSSQPEAARAAVAREAMPADEWLVRRAHGFGGSDLAPLFLLLGLRPVESAPRYVQDAARQVRKGARLGPRLLLEKAGFAGSLAGNGSMRIGSAREPELLATWRATLDGSQIDPGSVTHATAMPRELYPLVDRHCPRLTVTPDGWCRDVLGELAVIEMKCSRYDGESLPWYWALQVHAQIAVMDAAFGLVVLGRGWSRGMDASGAVDVWRVERDEQAIAEIRDAVIEGWKRVEQTREGKS